MSRRLWMCWGVVGLVGTGAITLAGRDAAQAHRRADREQRELSAVRAMAQELVALRAKQPAAREPASGLAARVSGAMARCGLPPPALASLTPGSSDGRGGVGRAVITLASPTLDQVGAFLASWRDAEPDWIVSSVELSPMLGAPAQPGTDLPLRTVIGIEAVGANEGGGT